MINYRKETLDLELCKSREEENLRLNYVRGNKEIDEEKNIILNRIEDLIGNSEDIKQVLDYISLLKIKDNTKIKITIQKQDFENSTNTTYEKIIVK